jgi:hypothetical protein
VVGEDGACVAAGVVCGELLGVVVCAITGDAIKAALIVRANREAHEYFVMGELLWYGADARLVHRTRTPCQRGPESPLPYSRKVS